MIALGLIGLAGGLMAGLLAEFSQHRRLARMAANYKESVHED